jgi:uncharacterized protein (DUF2249 family)
MASEWDESLDSVLTVEDDIGAALAALDALRNKWAPNGPSELCKMTTNEHQKVEEELLYLVAQLKQRRRIIGEPLALDDLLDPVEEREIGGIPYGFGGGDAEIVRVVQLEMGLARGDIMEIDSDHDPEVVPPSLKEMIDMCRNMEEYSMVVYEKGALDFVMAARRYRSHLQRMNNKGAKQTTLDTFFKS